LCEIFVIILLVVPFQGCSQKFTNWGKLGVWETKAPSGFQGQNMETLENTSEAVPKIDLWWRGTCTHVPPLATRVPFDFVVIQTSSLFEIPLFSWFFTGSNW